MSNSNTSDATIAAMKTSVVLQVVIFVAALICVAAVDIALILSDVLNHDDLGSMIVISIVAIGVFGYGVAEIGEGYRDNLLDNAERLAELEKKSTGTRARTPVVD